MRGLTKFSQRFWVSRWRRGWVCVVAETKDRDTFLRGVEVDCLHKGRGSLVYCFGGERRYSRASLSPPFLGRGSDLGADIVAAGLPNGRPAGCIGCRADQRGRSPRPHQLPRCRQASPPFLPLRPRAAGAGLVAFVETTPTDGTKEKGALRVFPPSMQQPNPALNPSPPKKR
jgi:hypothetical protein